MTLGELLVDAFNRIREGAESAVSGLSPEQLAERPTSNANSIGWLVWHLTRVAGRPRRGRGRPRAGVDERWLARAVRAALRRRRHRLRPHPRPGRRRCAVSTREQLVGYLDAVHAATRGLRPAAHPRRPRPGRRRALGPAGHARRTPGQRGQRRPAARRPGRLPPRAAWTPDQLRRLTTARFSGSGGPAPRHGAGSPRRTAPRAPSAGAAGAGHPLRHCASRRCCPR